MTKTLVTAVAACILVGGCAVKTRPAALGPASAMDGGRLPQAVAGIEGMEKDLFRDGRVLVGGQPAEGSFPGLAKLGVVAVVNLRPPREMSDKAEVPFDEAATAARLGMEYVSIPIGGTEYPYRPQAVEQLAQVLERVSGPVLVHCRSGVRASYLWAAYLVRYGGLDLDAAVARGRAMAIPPDPLGMLLDRQLKPAPAGAR